MTGIILMALGALLLIIGIVVFNSSKTNSAESLINQDFVNTEVQDIREPVLNEKETIKDIVEEASKEKNFEDVNLKSIIAMAIADGVLTQNERNAIRKIANEKSLDYDTIILDAEQQLKANKIVAETEVVDQDKKKGNDFEKYVVQKFNKKYYKLKEWAGDKYVNGTYAETTQHPDLVMEMKSHAEAVTFAVECKWRKGMFNGGIEFASPEQLKRYKKFEKQHNIPVFIAIGRGGEASNPKYLAIIPLSEIEETFLSFEMLKKYYKNTDKDFYYDVESGMLK